MSRSVSITRRRLLAAALAAPPAALVVPQGAWAQGLSKRPVRFIIPFTTSTGPDIVARILAPVFQSRWDQPFIVDNRPGASGTIGTEAVVKSPPDGHAMMIGPASIVTAPHLYSKIGYHVVNDLTPIALIGSTGLALAVHPSLPAANLQEFLAYVRARPGKLNYASPGNGTHHHLCMELLKVSTGLDIVHVPYKGSAQATNDLVAGTVPMMFLPIHVALPMQRAGQIRLLGGSLRERHPLFTELPSLHELGVKDYDVDLWLGLWGPPGMSAELVQKYNAELRAITTQPAMQDTLARQGLVVNVGSAESFGKLARDDFERWGRIIKQANIKPD